MEKYDFNATMKTLSEYIRIQEETSEIIESLKDELKKYMKENSLETLTGNEHKASYKVVASSRIDTKLLKADLPDIAEKYTRKTESLRFTFS